MISAQVETPPKSSYIPALDGIRALAFLFVFGAHATGHTISRLIPATFGVTVFFFLSGYLITTLLREEVKKTNTIKLKDFYIRRSLRIFIPMYVAYVTNFLLCKLTPSLSVGNLRGFLSAILYCYNYASFSKSVQVPTGFESIWTLGVEEHFYLLFPCFFLFYFVRKGLSRQTQSRILTALCVVALCWRSAIFFSHRFPVRWPYMATDCRFDGILWGCVLAISNNPHLDPIPSVFKRRGGVFAGIALVLLFAAMVVPSTAFRETLRYTFQPICLYFIFHFAVSSSKHWTVRWLNNNVLRYIGWLSYSLYLIHKPILYFLEVYMPPKDWLLSATCFILSIGYAVLVRHAVELPLQRLRARFRHVAPPVAPGMAVEGI